MYDVCYSEVDSDEDVDSDDVIEWADEQEEDTNADADGIEKVLHHRWGRVKATGSQVRCLYVKL